MTSTKLTLPVSDHDHVLGPANAAVTLVEYGDYECPHCGHAHIVVERLRLQLGAQLRFVFRNFPLTEIHPHAEAAAEAAEAAATRDRFWKMHDTLMTNQDALELDDLVEYAAELGIDTAWFTTALTTRTFQKKVREDFMGGVRSGVNGTPTFFINGSRHDGPATFESLSQALEEALDVE